MEAYGVSPVQYHRTRRMELAARMLAHSTKSVKEVSASLGYDDQLCFSRDFRKHHGISPRHFRNRWNPR
jgi:AraC-like DNA-binding protein